MCAGCTKAEHTHANSFISQEFQCVFMSLEERKYPTTTQFDECTDTQYVFKN